MRFDINYTIAKSAKGKEEKREEVPVTIMIGVTVSLCELFLIYVPLPGCQIAGGWLLNTGVGILGSDALARWDLTIKNKGRKTSNIRAA